jgi:hypothetical protein
MDSGTCLAVSAIAVRCIAIEHDRFECELCGENAIFKVMLVHNVPVRSARPEDRAAIALQSARALPPKRNCPLEDG